MRKKANIGTPKLKLDDNREPKTQLILTFTIIFLTKSIYNTGLTIKM